MGKELSKENINTLISCNYSKISGYHDLEPQVWISASILGLILGFDSLYALKFMEDGYKFMIKHRRAFKEKFARDKLFRYKFIYALNEHFQWFLEAYVNATSIEDVNNLFFDLLHIGQSVIHLKFSCNLPYIFLDSTSVDLPSKSSDNKNTSVQKDSERYIKNDFS